MPLEKRIIKINQKKDIKAQPQSDLIQFTYTPKKGEHYKLEHVNQKINLWRERLLKDKVKGQLQAVIRTANEDLAFNNYDVNNSIIKLSKEDLGSQYDFFDADKNPLEKELLPKFWIIIRKDVKAGGCDGKFNDCLFECLYKCNMRRYKAYHIKELLGLARNDKVDISHIPYIEKKFYVNIHVSGDAVYEGKNEHQKNIYLVLQNGHYTINSKINRVTKSKAIKTIIVFEFDKDERVYNFYESLGGLQQLETMPSNKKYILYRLDEIQKMTREKLTLQDAYKWIIDQINKVKEYSEGKIDPSIGIQKFIKVFFNGVIQSMGIKVDPIEQYEFEILEKTVRGPYYFKPRNGKYKKGYEEDQKSSYPFFLHHQKFFIPIKKGTLKTITQKEFNQLEYFTYGCYHCDISEHKKFKHNPKEWYTHFDLQIAKKLNCEIKIFEDGEPNILSYAMEGENKRIIPSSTIFKNYIDLVYKLKNEHPDCILFKSLISTIHGALCQVVRKYHKIDKNSSTESTCDIGDHIYNKTIKNSTGWMAETFDVNKFYLTNLARLKPFLYAKQKAYMFEHVIDKYYDNILFFCTDGFILDIPYEEVNTTSNIGDIVLKKEWSDFEIINNKLPKTN